MTDVPEKFTDDRPDLDPRAMRPAKILQNTSPELAPGSDRLDAQAGDFLLYYEDGSQKVFPRIPGVTLLPVVFIERAMEWPLERGSGNAPVYAHDFVPADAEWLVIDATGRKACVRPNGNRIEKTIFLHALVEEWPVTFSFRATSYPIGQRLGSDADRTRVQVDGETVRVCAAMYRLSSDLERNGKGQTWYGPRYEKLGVLGQKTGPSIELVRRAKILRFELKLEEERRKNERASLSAPRPTPVLSVPDPRPRGTTTFTSGLSSAPPRSWADPRPPAQPAQSVDPKLNDDIPW
jgi:hypothetical protein